MRFVWIVTVPLGLIVLFIGGAPSMLNVKPRPNPDRVILNNEADYKSKAEQYAQLDMRQDALKTCAAINSELKNGDVDYCLLGVYEILDDTNGKIEVYERRVLEKQAAGDSTALTESVLKGLKEKRDKKR